MLNLKIYALLFQTLLLKPAATADPLNRPTVLVPDNIRVPVQVPLDVQQLEAEFPQYFPHGDTEPPGSDQSISDAIRAIKLLTGGEIPQPTDDPDSDVQDELLPYDNSQSPLFTSVLKGDEDKPPMLSQVEYAPPKIGIINSGPDFSVPIHVPVRVPFSTKPETVGPVQPPWPIGNSPVRLPVLTDVMDLNMPLRAPFVPINDNADSLYPDLSAANPLRAPYPAEPGLPHPLELPLNLMKQNIHLPLNVDLGNLDIPLRNIFAPTATKFNPKQQYYKMGNSLMDPMSYYKSKDTPGFLAKFHNRLGRKKMPQASRKIRIHDPSVKMLNPNPYMPSGYTQLINQWTLHHLTPVSVADNSVINQIKNYQNQDDTGFLRRLGHQLQLQNSGQSPWDLLRLSGIDQNQPSANQITFIKTFRPAPHIPTAALPLSGPWSYGKQNPSLSNERVLSQLKAYRNQDSTGFLEKLLSHMENKQPDNPLFRNLPNSKGFIHYRFHVKSA